MDDDVAARETQVVPAGWVAWCCLCNSDVYGVVLERRKPVGPLYLPGNYTRVERSPIRVRCIPCDHTTDDKDDRMFEHLLSMRFSGVVPHLLAACL